jgi:seryl-tRNA synthetase
MIDPKLLRQSTADVAKNLSRRGFDFDVDAYLALEERRKSLQVNTENLRNERNSSSKNIGKAKAQEEDIAPLLAAVKDLGDRLEQNEVALQALLFELQSIELGLPNLLDDDVPDGRDEDDNVEVRRWANPPNSILRPGIISKSEKRSACWSLKPQAKYPVHVSSSCEQGSRACNVH